jgi:hypothetical protein
MKINIFFVLAVAVFCLSLSIAASAEMAGQMISIGGGCFGGMTGAAAEILYHRPFNFLDSDKIYGKMGLAVADSLNIYPTKDWRRFLLLYIDGVMYFYGNTYLGGGLNFPIKVSDDEVGNLGGEVYLGMDLPIYHRGKIYAELGYSIVRRLNFERYEGVHFMVGWRYELVPASAPKKEAATEIQPAKPAIPSPEAAAIEITPSSAEAQREKIMSEMTELTGELEKTENYISQLDKKIVKAKSAKAVKKVLELKTLKLDAIMRARSIKEKIKEKESGL